MNNMKINETFRSIQGEGKRIGVVTFFIRTTGCNLNCSWCDTQYAMSEGKEMSVDELIKISQNENEICFTGGEPLLQKDAFELVKKLSDAGKTVVVETNGSIDISEIQKIKSENVIVSMDIKCPSSQMHEKMLFSNIAKLKNKDQLKFIIADEKDMNYAISIIDKYKPKCESIFSPVGGMDLEPLAEEIIDLGLKVRVLPQLHKIIWKDRTGV